MNAIKKLTAVLLSVMMFLGLVVVIPASAEDTVSKTYDLLDLSDASVGVLDTSAYPDGVSEYDFAQGIAAHTGEKQIVQNADGKNVVQLNLADFYQAEGADKTYPVCDRMVEGKHNEAYSLLFRNIPADHIPYITAINLKMKKSDGSAARVVYEFAVSNGDYSGWSKNSTYTNSNIEEGETEANVSYDPNSLTMVSKWGVQNKGDDEGTSWNKDYSFAFLTLTAHTADGAEAGTLTIEDVSYTVTATSDVISGFNVAKKFNVFDFSNAATGTYTADTMPYPSDFSEFTLDGTTAHSDAKTIVANNGGKKVLRFDLSKFTITTVGQSNKLASAGYNQVYAAQMLSIPASHIPYITSVNLKMSKSADSTAIIAYEVGVTDGIYYSKTDYNNNTVGSTTKDVNLSLNISDLYKGRVWNVSYNWGSPSGSWNDDFTGIFFTFAAYTEDGGTAGTLDIKEISYTVSATETVWNEMPLERKVDLLNLSDVALGDFDTASYPVGVSEFQFPTGSATPTTMYDGARKVVANAAGKKVLQLDLNGLTYSGTEKLINRISQGAYTPVYAVKLMDIPTAYAPYLGNINLKLKKSDDSNARVLYEFGMTDGVLYSKKSSNQNQVMDAATKEINISYGRSELTQTTAWKLGWDSTNAGTNWVDKAYTGIFLAIGAYTEEGKTAGTITIEEISCTVSAPASFWKAEVTEELKTTGASLTLQNDITSNVAVDKDILIDNGFSKPYMTFEFEGETTTVNNPTVKNSGGIDYYTFAFEDIAPHKMMKDIKATLYATFNGEVITGETKTYKAAEYCYAVLANYNDAKLNTLAVDLLNYAAAAQTYMGSTDALANVDLTDDQKLLASADPTEYFNSTNTKYEEIEDPSVYWRGATLELTKDIKMMFLIQAEDITGLTVKATTDENPTGWTIDSSKFVKYAENFYLVYFDGFDASQMSETVYLTVNNAEGAVSDTLSYSIESYVAAKANGGNALADLVKAMFKYGNAAKAYKP